MENIILDNGIIRAEISPFGGQPMSICKLENGKAVEYLWQSDPKYWKDRAPILFPVVGRIRNGAYTHKGKKYEMRCHGFAAWSEHKVSSCTNDEVTMTLEDNEETRAQYPFGFVFTQNFKLDGNRLVIKAEATAKEELWCALGGHPGFVLPNEAGDGDAPFDSLYVRLNDNKAPQKVVLTKDCFMQNDREKFSLVDDEGKFKVEHEIFDDDAIVLDNVKSASLISTKTNRSVTVSSPDAAFYGFWQTRYSRDARFLCLEPWQGQPSEAGGAELDELSERKRMYHLMPGESASFTFDIVIE